MTEMQFENAEQLQRKQLLERKCNFFLSSSLIVNSVDEALNAALFGTVVFYPVEPFLFSRQSLKWLPQIFAQVFLQNVFVFKRR